MEDVKVKNRIANLGLTKNKIIALLVVLITIPLVIGFFAHEQNRRNNPNPDVLSAQDIEKLEEKVAKLALIPIDEQPEIATISDDTNLSQEFFRFAKNGDKLLIYRQAKRVILYRPSENVIVETGPLIDPTPTPEGAPLTEITPQPIIIDNSESEASASPTIEPESDSIEDLLLDN